MEEGLASHGVANPGDAGTTGKRVPKRPGAQVRVRSTEMTETSLTWQLPRSFRLERAGRAVSGLPWMLLT